MLQIGVPYCGSVNTIINHLRPLGGVKILDYNTGTVGVDIVVIPDKIGLYPGCRCFGLKTPNTIMDNDAEVFRIYALQKFIERDIPIIGIGDGAAMLWNCLEQHVEEVSKTLRLIIPVGRKDIQFTDDGLFVTSFKHKSLYGFNTFGVNALKVIQHYNSIVNAPEEPPMGEIFV